MADLVGDVITTGKNMFCSSLMGRSSEAPEDHSGSSESSDQENGVKGAKGVSSICYIWVAGS